jgi:hypothetical protein
MACRSDAKEGDSREEHPEFDFISTTIRRVLSYFITVLAMDLQCKETAHKSE